MKSINIKNPILLSEYDSDTFFTMVFIEENKSRKLGSQKVGESFVFMLFDKFLDCLNCIEKDAI